VAQNKKEPSVGARFSQSFKAIIFELEYVALQARVREYAAIARVMAARGVELTPVLYARVCLHRTPAQFVPELLKIAGKGSASGEKAEGDVREALAAIYSDGSLKIAAPFAKFLESAGKAGKSLAAVSRLERDAARGLAERVGLAETPLAGALSAGSAEPGPDAFLRAARKVNTVPTRCVAMVSSASGFQAALKGNLKSVVVPDPYTAHEDFGGADIVLASIEDLDYAVTFGPLTGAGG
jgi:beta-phosphoglucomutase-like phosphatase (HAD superfamily)